jgi:hypothetical protein
VTDGLYEKAAVLARQRGERLLRTILYFFAATGWADIVLQILETPGSLVIPRRMTHVIEHEEGRRGVALLDALRENGWADLGFLALAVRKRSSWIEAAGQRALLTQGESEAILALGRALQAIVWASTRSLTTGRCSGGLRRLGRKSTDDRRHRRSPSPAGELELARHPVDELGGSRRRSGESWRALR